MHDTCSLSTDGLFMLANTKARSYNKLTPHTLDLGIQLSRKNCAERCLLHPMGDAQWQPLLFLRAGTEEQQILN